MKNKQTPSPRTKNWETLKKSGVVFLWEPFMVDAALSHPVPFSKVDEILDSPIFLIKCHASATRVKKYENFTWNKSSVLEKSAGGILFYNFLKRASSNLAAKASLGQLSSDDFSELCSVLLEKIATSIQDFRPVSPKNPHKTWGFEAYIFNYAVRKAQKPSHFISKSHTFSNNKGFNFISIDAADMASGFSQRTTNLNILESARPDLFSWTDTPPSSMTDDTCKNLLFSAVCKSLKGHPSAMVYYRHVVLGENIRSVSSALKITKSTCHRLAQEASEMVWEELSKSSSELLKN